MEQIIRQAVCKHLMDNAVLNKSQHGFLRNKSCQTNLISFFERVTSFVDAENAVDVIYFDFSKTFDKVPHDILVSKLVKTGLDKVTIQWICNWLAGKNPKGAHQWFIFILEGGDQWCSTGLCAGASIV